MAIQVKSGGAYADVTGVFVKQGGVYSAADVYAKVAGAYLMVSNNFSDTLYKFFGNRTYAPQGTSNVSTSIYRVSRVYLGQTSTPLHSLRIALPGHYNVTNGAFPCEIAAASTITVEGVSVGWAATQDPTTATWQIGSFSGNTGVTIDPAVNPVGVLSDDIVSAGAPIPAGSHVWAMVAIQAVSGSTLPRCVGFGPGSVEGATSSTTTSRFALLTNGATITTSAAGSNDYGPMFVVAKGIQGPAVLAWGDSIGYGEQETNFSATLGVRGFINRGLQAAGIPVFNACVAGSRPEHWVNNGAAGSVQYKLGLIDLVPNTPFNAIIHEGGTNSAATWNSESLMVAGEKALIGLLKSEFPNVPVAQTFLAPKVSTTDACTTLANQTPITGFGVGGFISAFNTKLATDLLDGVADAYIDQTTVIRDSVETVKIKGNPTVYTLAADYTASSTTVVLTAAPDTDEWIVIGSTACAVRGVTGTGPYTVTVVNGSSTALTSGQSVLTTYSPDGTHFTGEMHKLMAGSVQAWGNTL